MPLNPILPTLLSRSACARIAARLLVATSALCAVLAAAAGPLVSPQDAEAGVLTRHGRIVWHGGATAFEPLTLALERNVDLGPLDSLYAGSFQGEPDFARMPWERVGPVEIADDGTFRFDVPDDAKFLRIVAEGRFSLGIAPFEVDGHRDPREAPLEVEVFIGGEVVLELELPPDATEEERAALVGRAVGARFGSSPLFSGAGWPSGDGDPSGFSVCARTSVVDESLQVVLTRVPPITGWLMRPSGTTEGDTPFAPFAVPPGYDFRPAAGERTRLVLPLWRGLIFAGSLVDQEGRPVEDATLDVLALSGTANPESHRCKTDREGRFRVDGLTQAPDELHVYHTDLGSPILRGPRVRDLAAAPGGELVVERRPRLVLRVTTPEGAPASGVSLAVTDLGGHWQSQRSVTTDAEGLATLDGLSGDRVDVRAFCKPVGPADAGGVVAFTAPARAETYPGADVIPATSLYALEALGVEVTAEPVDLRLRPAPALRVRVHGYDPKADLLRLRVVPEGELSTRYGLTRGQVCGGTLRPAREPSRTEAPTFHLQVAPGRYHVAAVTGDGVGQVPDMAKLRATPHVDVDVEAADSLHEVELDFGAAAPMEGVVRLADGTPATDATVHVTRSIGGYSDARTEVRVDAEGRFRTVPLIGGKYYVNVEFDERVARAGRSGVPFDPAAPESVELSAEDLGRIEVHFDGEPADLRIAGQTPIGYWSALYAFAEPTATLAPRPAGLYAVGVAELHADGSTTMHIERVEVTAGEVAEVTLERSKAEPRELRGLVTLGGASLPGATLVAHQDGFAIARCTTDVDGRYRLRHHATGELTLFVGTVLSQAAMGIVDVSEAAEQSFDLALPGGGIVGASTRNRGTTHQWFRLRRLGRPEPEDARAAIRRDRGATFVFLGLEDGEYEVALLDWEREVIERAVVSVSGGEITRDVRLESTKD